MRFKYDVKIWDRNSQNWAGHRKNAIFSIFGRNHLTHVWNRVLVISLDGWRVRRWNLYRCSPCVFSIASTKFHIDRERRFLYEFIVEKLVFWGFRGYLGESESEKIISEFFIHFFFWMRSVVSGSVLQNWHSTAVLDRTIQKCVCRPRNGWWWEKGWIQFFIDRGFCKDEPGREINARVSMHRCKKCYNLHEGAEGPKFLPWAMSTYVNKYSELSPPFHVTAEDGCMYGIGSLPFWTYVHNGTHNSERLRRGKCSTIP